MSGWEERQDIEDLSRADVYKLKRCGKTSCWKLERHWVIQILCRLCNLTNNNHNKARRFWSDLLELLEVGKGCYLMRWEEEGEELYKSLQQRAFKHRYIKPYYMLLPYWVPKKLKELKMQEGRLYLMLSITACSSPKWLGIRSGTPLGRLNIIAGHTKSYTARSKHLRNLEDAGLIEVYPGMSKSVPHKMIVLNKPLEKEDFEI